MVATQKFMFDTAFDQTGNEKSAKPLPTHTDEQVEQVRADAFQAGHEAALVEARRIEERRIAEIFSAMALRIDELCETRAADTGALARQATEVAVAICRKVMPEMARRNALSEVEGMIGECLAAMPEEPRIVVRVADGTVDRLQARIAEFAGGFGGKLVLLGDDEMPVTDCAVVWADGGTERNLDRLWQEIDAAVERMLASSLAADGAASTADEPRFNDDRAPVGGETANGDAMIDAAGQPADETAAIP
jgi:flagellar assembly protein FliH